MIASSPRKPPVRFFFFLALMVAASGLQTQLRAQDWVRTGTNLGVQKIRVAAADFKAGSADPQTADNQRVPGQMSQEEARELLDSVKGDEHQSMPIPWAQRGAVQPPDKPFKNW